MEFTLTVFILLFWIALVEIAIGLLFLLFNNDSWQKLINAFAIIFLGIFAAWLSSGTCTTIKNQLQSEIFSS